MLLKSISKLFSLDFQLRKEKLHTEWPIRVTKYRISKEMWTNVSNKIYTVYFIAY